jgi:malic enzyme
MTFDLRKESLKYHSSFPQGKLKISPSKPVKTQKDLTMAYTPGVADPCIEISKDKEKVFSYTNRGNSVAIITDGTAVLGLGKIGPLAALPVMEGKSVLFKKFADIDAYPICLNLGGGTGGDYLNYFVSTVKAMEPSFGGINLEDIAAPTCFDLQEKLSRGMSIPVFHDDQKGTAIVMLAALTNALKLVGKKFENIKVVMSGAGAAGIAIAKLLCEYKVPKKKIFLCDSKGLVVNSRDDINDEKRNFAQQATPIGLGEALENADVFIGASAAGVLNPEMIKNMSKLPIIFAAANPVPEIMPEKAFSAGAYIVATGRSDFQNQINNSLGFPGIFRGALDVRAKTINMEMQIAASKAIAELVNEPATGKILKILKKAYPKETKMFSSPSPLNKFYIVPKQFDLRVVPRVARMVAKTAMETKVAQVKIDDLESYEKSVFKRILANWD